MSLIIIGEAAAKVMDGHAEFAQTHPEVPWRSMRGMRNRIAHGYFEINLDLVWDTVLTALPELLKQLHAVRQWRPQQPRPQLLRKLLRHEKHGREDLEKALDDRREPQEEMPERRD